MLNMLATRALRSAPARRLLARASPRRSLFDAPLAVSVAPNTAAFAASQRQPTAFRGDWGAVLAADTAELISSGHNWTEGPVWAPAEGALYFTDAPGAKIYRWTEAEGAALYIRDGGGLGGPLGVMGRGTRQEILLKHEQLAEPGR